MDVKKNDYFFNLLQKTHRAPQNRHHMPHKIYILIFCPWMENELVEQKTLLSYIAEGLRLCIKSWGGYGD